jgi:hypothetical protein
MIFLLLEQIDNYNTVFLVCIVIISFYIFYYVLKCFLRKVYDIFIELSYK